MTLPEGLYDLLVTERLAAQLETAQARTEPLVEGAVELLVDTLTRQLGAILEGLPEDEAGKGAQQLALINSLLTTLRQRLLSGNDREAAAIDLVDPVAVPPRRLVAVQHNRQFPTAPDVGLATPWLFTAGKGSPSLLQEIRRELASADQVDILVSFITVSGVRKLQDVLQQITACAADGGIRTPIRILTTTYTGATEARALDELARLPGCEVRVSLDGRRTRLHAKAWLFHRRSGFGSAYVGSANLSGAALTGGLEWTVKLAQRAQPELLARAEAHFETLWADSEFQHYDPDNTAHREALASALGRESFNGDGAGNVIPAFFDLQPKTYQQDMLEQLQAERAHGRRRNLLVAATGTGKTVVAAFDYRATCQREGGRPRLLFVAHREEILRQAQRTFREVLRDPDFGELLTGGREPERLDHLFATIDSLTSRDTLAQVGRRAGLPAACVVGNTAAEERRRAPQRLLSGELCALVTVDLYNEGIDLPMVDTLLLLRPTQSPVLFQQQIGRGLRLAPNKESCLVLDFVGQHRSEFRFDRLLSSLTGLPRRALLEGVEHGFGSLPPGCHIHLQRQTRDQVLSGLQSLTHQTWRRLRTELQTYAALNGRTAVRLADFLHEQALELEDVYRAGTGQGRSGWTALKRDAGLIVSEPGPEEPYFSRRFADLLHVDDPLRLDVLAAMAHDPAAAVAASRQAVQMLAYQIDGRHEQLGPADAFAARLARHTPVLEELGELAALLTARARLPATPVPGLEDTPLCLHASYGVREVLTAVGWLSDQRRAPFQAGVLPLNDRQTELLFVTLDKRDGFHDRIAYRDYAISAERFHWQTQKTAGPDTPMGRRYLLGETSGWQFAAAQGRVPGLRAGDLRIGGRGSADEHHVAAEGADAGGDVSGVQCVEGG